MLGKWSYSSHYIDLLHSWQATVILTQIVGLFWIRSFNWVIWMIELTEERCVVLTIIFIIFYFCRNQWSISKLISHFFAGYDCWTCVLLCGRCIHRWLAVDPWRLHPSSRLYFLMTMLLWHGHPMLGLVRVRGLAVWVQIPRSPMTWGCDTCERWQFVYLLKLRNCTG